MVILFRWLLMASLGVFVMTAEVDAIDLQNTLYLDLEYGRVVIELKPDLAPKHVERIKELSRLGFYDGLKWHRVIDGFMAQTGDPKGIGTGGSDKENLEAEFSSEPHLRGTVSMARSQDPDSANSQFFIVFAPAAWLDGQYTVWGNVTNGMEFVDQIHKGDSQTGQVENPDIIVRMQVAADEK